VFVVVLDADELVQRELQSRGHVFQKRMEPVADGQNGERGVVDRGRSQVRQTSRAVLALIVEVESRHQVI